jgi:hypothetical protein
MADARQQVAKAAWSCQQKVFTLQGNRDIDACVQDILTCMAKPTMVAETVTKLSASTFVQVRCQLQLACVIKAATADPADVPSVLLRHAYMRRLSH